MRECRDPKCTIERPCQVCVEWLNQRREAEARRIQQRRDSQASLTLPMGLYRKPNIPKRRAAKPLDGQLGLPLDIPENPGDA